MKRGWLGFFCKNKKGMSDVIVTLLLVMLAIVLVGVVFVVVNNIVRIGSQQASSAQECLSSEVEVSAFSCTLSGNECNVTVKRTLGSDTIGGVRILFTNDAGDSNTSDSAGNINTLASKKFTARNLGVSNITVVSAAVYFLDSSGRPNVCSFSSSGLVGSVGAGGTSGNGGSSGSTTSNNNNNNSNNNNKETTTGCTPAEPNFCSLHNYQCGTFSNGTCSGTISCGALGATGQDGCNLPLFCNSTYQCQAPKLLNSGIVLSAWPSGAPRFFDSNDLPKSQVEDYALTVGAQYNQENSWVRFPDNFNSPNCTQIAYIEYQSEVNRSFVYLIPGGGNDYVNVTAGGRYRIWDTHMGCVDDTVT